MKTAFVIPFYGSDIGGGAETQCRRLAENLAQRGADVEVLTTTLRDLATDWSHNYYDPGIYTVNGVTVRRFLVNPSDMEILAPINRKLMAREPVMIEEEIDYADNAVNSQLLYQFIGDNKKDYVYFFIPYLFGVSLNGVSIAPEKSFLIPCLHDEGYAYMRITRRMFEKVSGVLFNSRAEMELAKDLYEGLVHTEPILMGEGVDEASGADGARFREKYNLGSDPFIVYVGRRDQTKNTPLLVDYFWRYRRLNPESNLRLVSMGSGCVPIPDDIAEYTLDLGFVSTADRRDAIAGATLLCQPSLMESFSLVMMESWLCGRPALVHSRCAATKEHALNSGAGMLFDSFEEFCAAVDTLLEDPALADEMGRRGRAYVRANFSWDVICGRFMKLIEACDLLPF